MLSENLFEKEKSKTIKSDGNFWFFLAFLIGFVIRITNLSEVVFTQGELVLAHQALQISRQIIENTSSVPAYTGLTSFTFFIFEANNFLARLWPAVIGSLLILLPLAWKDKLGEKASLILSFALALDPTMIVFSRAISGGIFALVGLVASVSFLKIKKPLLAGLSAGLAFLSGTVFWVFFVLLISLLYFLNRVEQPFKFKFSDTRKLLPGTGVGFSVSILFLSTSFLLNLKGLSGIGSGLTALLQTFTLAYEKPIYHSIYLLIAHSILPITLFIFAFWRTNVEKVSKALKLAGLSILLSIFFCLLVCRNEYSLLMWPVLIAWIVGARILGNLKWDRKILSMPAIGLIAFVLVILIYLMIQFKNLAEQSFGNSQFWNINLLILAGVILLASAFWLVSFAWTKMEGVKSFQVAFLIFLGFLSLGSTFRGLSQQQPYRWLEYLDNHLILPNRDTDHIMHEFSLSGKALEQLGYFSLEELPSETEWFFRNFSKTSDKQQAAIGMSYNDTPPETQLPYRGMSVVFDRSINWFEKPIDLYLRAILSNFPTFDDQNAILWVQTNLFTGATQ